MQYRPALNGLSIYSKLPNTLIYQKCKNFLHFLKLKQVKKAFSLLFASYKNAIYQLKKAWFFIVLMPAFTCLLYRPNSPGIKKDLNK